MKQPDWVRVDLDEGTSISVPRSVALTLDEKGFAKLYRAHVLNATRRQARNWARVQVARREEQLARANQ